MSNSLKQVRRIMLVAFAATTGVVACDSATAPEQQVAPTVIATDRQVVEEDLGRFMQEDAAWRRKPAIE